MAALYGLADLLGRKPVYYVQDEEFAVIITFVSKVMPGIFDQFLIVNSTLPSETLQVEFHSLCCNFQDPMEFKKLQVERLHLTGQFYQSFKYFNHLRQKLLSFLRPPADYLHLPKSTDKNGILCIHVRRSDFLDGNRQASDEEFIRKAAKLIEQRDFLNTTRKMSTVIFGDDVQFEKDIFSGAVVAHPNTRAENIQNVYVSTNRPEHDLLYARNHCDIVLISAAVSTFGWWMAYLSKNNQAYYIDIRYTNDFQYRTGMLTPGDYYLPTWTPLRVDKDQNVVISEVN